MVPTFTKRELKNAGSNMAPWGTEVRDFVDGRKNFPLVYFDYTFLCICFYILNFRRR